VAVEGWRPVEDLDRWACVDALVVSTDNELTGDGE
jgi:hypothetical protein